MQNNNKGMAILDSVLLKQSGTLNGLAITRQSNVRAFFTRSGENNLISRFLFSSF